MHPFIVLKICGSRGALVVPRLRSSRCITVFMLFETGEDILREISLIEQLSQHEGSPSTSNAALTKRGFSVGHASFGGKLWVGFAEASYVLVVILRPLVPSTTFLRELS